MRKPGQSLDWLKTIIDRFLPAMQKNDRIVFVAIRGYFRDSMGEVGKNDRRIYDDAMFIVDTATGWFASWNENVDPNGVRKGRGTGSSKGMARLKPGIWRYKPGLHKGYQAFVQAGEVTVLRDGVAGDYEDTGYFGINIHKGGANSVSSLGCLTTPPDQWKDFKETGYAKLKAANQKTFPLILVELQG